MPTVMLGVTGCIGAYKACEVLRELQRRDIDVHVVMTQHATRFVTRLSFEALSRHPVFVDQLELGAQGEILHVSLADAADALLVAPATANVVAKFARGIADDDLSTLHLATRAPVIVAPAMNVNMFEHPAFVRTSPSSWARGVRVVEPRRIRRPACSPRRYSNPGYAWQARARGRYDGGLGGAHDCRYRANLGTG